MADILGSQFPHFRGSYVVVGSSASTSLTDIAGTTGDTYGPTPPARTNSYMSPCVYDPVSTGPVKDVPALSPHAGPTGSADSRAGGLCRRPPRTPVVDIL